MMIKAAPVSVKDSTTISQRSFNSFNMAEDENITNCPSNPQRNASRINASAKVNSIIFVPQTMKYKIQRLKWDIILYISI